MIEFGTDAGPWVLARLGRSSASGSALQEDDHEALDRISSNRNPARREAGRSIAGTRGRTEVLTFVDVRQQTEFLDTGQVGGDPSSGDTYFFDSALHVADHGDAASRGPMGRFVSLCTVLFGSQVKCAGSLLLRDGTIEIAGAPDFAADAPIVAAVTGGTGRYARAAGTATITGTEVEGTSMLVIELAKPR